MVCAWLGKAIIDELPDLHGRLVINFFVSVAVRLRIFCLKSFVGHKWSRYMLVLFFIESNGGTAIAGVLVHSSV